MLTKGSAALACAVWASSSNPDASLLCSVEDALFRNETCYPNIYPNIYPIIVVSIFFSIITKKKKLNIIYPIIL